MVRHGARRAIATRAVQTVMSGPASRPSRSAFTSTRKPAFANRHHLRHSGVQPRPTWRRSRAAGRWSRPSSSWNTPGADPVCRWSRRAHGRRGRAASIARRRYGGHAAGRPPERRRDARSDRASARAAASPPSPTPTWCWVASARSPDRRRSAEVSADSCAPARPRCRGQAARVSDMPCRRLPRSCVSRQRQDGGRAARPVLAVARSAIRAISHSSPSAAPGPLHAQDGAPPACSPPPRC